MLEWELCVVEPKINEDVLVMTVTPSVDSFIYVLFRTYITYQCTRVFKIILVSVHHGRSAHLIISFVCVCISYRAPLSVSLRRGVCHWFALFSGYWFCLHKFVALPCSLAALE